LYGLADKNAIRSANNNLLMRCDELWVFGERSDGVDVEVAYAQSTRIPIRWFDVDHYGETFAERLDGAPAQDDDLGIGPVAAVSSP
jgi:hypothetical protein